MSVMFRYIRRRMVSRMDSGLRRNDTVLGMAVRAGLISVPCLPKSYNLTPATAAIGWANLGMSSLSY